MELGMFAEAREKMQDFNSCEIVTPKEVINHIGLDPDSELANSIHVLDGKRPVYEYISRIRLNESFARTNMLSSEGHEDYKELYASLPETDRKHLYDTMVSADGWGQSSRYAFEGFKSEGHKNIVREMEVIESQDSVLAEANDFLRKIEAWSRSGLTKSTYNGVLKSFAKDGLIQKGGALELHLKQKQPTNSFLERFIKESNTSEVKSEISLIANYLRKLIADNSSEYRDLIDDLSKA